MSIPYDFDATLRDCIERLEWESYQRQQNILSEIRLLEAHRQSGGLRYGTSPDIDQLLDDEWAAHDARLRRGE